MAYMGATVRAYIQDMNDSLACLDEKEVVVRQYACDRLSATCFDLVIDTTFVRSDHTAGEEMLWSYVNVLRWGYFSVSS